MEGEQPAAASPHTCLQPCWLTLKQGRQHAPRAQDKQASREFLKISALTFMRLGLATASAQAWQPHLPSLGPLVVSSMGERYYKVLRLVMDSDLHEGRMASSLCTTCKSSHRFVPACKLREQPRAGQKTGRQTGHGTAMPCSTACQPKAMQACKA